VATIAQLRNRSEELFTSLLAAQVAKRRQPARRAAAPAAFSWFDPRDAVAAAALSFRLSAHGASRKRPSDALSNALDHVEAEMIGSDPERVRVGFALFVTHNREGRRLAKPRTAAAAPRLFSPPRTGAAPEQRISIGGLSPGLDYWREDVLANEHHQHWHEVYPFTGLPPRSFPEWLARNTKADLVEILNALQPDPGWAEFVASATPQQLAALFAEVVQAEALFSLPPELYTKLFHLNDRQGELFFYMHEQMLARYDAELLSSDLARVEPYGPTAWNQPIAAGHDPIEVPDYGRREPGETLASADAQDLRRMWQEIDDALDSKNLRGANGGTIPIDRTNLGEAVEPAVSQLRALDPDAYGGLHGTGHVLIARLATPAGVMRNTVTAIRDPVFWQWHKFIDNINARWQKELAPYEFADAPSILVRDSLGPGTAEPWTSPDIILCRSVDLPEGVAPQSLGEQLFGGANWSTDFTAGTAAADGVSLETVDVLTTRMASVIFGDRQISYLTHEPFSYFLRIENASSTSLDVTVRIFLAPADQAADRRAWMEMDKFLLQLPASSKFVAYRPDTESSVVKRPVDASPADVSAGGGDPDENSYCDCGWPYTLLLPRGKQDGMAYRLLVLCTDAAIDRVSHAEHCGSMSYCGAVDRYPDTRDMGYPFSRPFAGPKPTAIRDAILALPTAAARTVSIRHG
jgi:Hemocyanin, ig-like domain/Hemocyanin, copper containing domain